MPSLRQYIKTPLFVVENQYDTNQLYAQEGVPKKPSGAAQQKQKDDYIKYYGNLMRDSVETQIKGHGQTKPTKDGVFFPSCFDHGMTTSTTMAAAPTAGGAAVQVNYMDVLGDWFFERGKYASHVVIDTCVMKADGYPCNPTCPNTAN